MSSVHYIVAPRLVSTKASTTSFPTYNSGTKVSAVFYPDRILKQKSVQVQEPDDVPAHDISTPLCS